MRLKQRGRRARLERAARQRREAAAGHPRASGAVLIGTAALGAAIMALRDRRRRHMARDRLLATARSAARQADRGARYAGGVAKGTAFEATAPARQAGREYDDVTLARKVETEILRPADAPKSAISVNARGGVVELRGEVKRPEDIKALGDAAAKVHGVKDVQNLLHTPGSPPKHSPASSAEEVRARAEQPPAQSRFSRNPATTTPSDEPTVERAREPGRGT
jgi:osmotically-inducible protein OsmY